MERITKTGRAYAVAAAAAHDLNDELTVIINGLSESLEYIYPNHPAWEYLLEMQAAARRAVWKVTGLLNYSAVRGARPLSIALERLIASDPPLD